MKQAELYRALSKLTGESVQVIKHMGFNVVNVPIPRRASEHFRRRRQRHRLKAVAVSA